MNSSIYVAVIGAVAAIATASLTYAFTKRREREADWRKLKLEMYKEFAGAMAGMADGDAGDEEKVRFNLACNSLHLIANKATVDALETFRQEIRAGNENFNLDRHDTLLSRLFWEIRRDLGDAPTNIPEDFKVKLYTSGKHKRP